MLSVCVGGDKMEKLSRNIDVEEALCAISPLFSRENEREAEMSP